LDFGFPILDYEGAGTGRNGMEVDNRKSKIENPKWENGAMNADNQESASQGWRQGNPARD
jgi:hypothetical protein